MKDNPNKIWVVVSPLGARVPEYYQYNSVAEALSDFDDWTLDTGSITSCEILYRGVPLMQSSKGHVRGAACEKYYQDCSVRDKLPNPLEIRKCEECVKKMMADYVM